MEGLPSTRSILSSALEDIKGASKILGKIAVPIVFAHAAVGAFVIGFSLEASGFRASGPIAMSAFDSPWIRILQTAMQLVGLFVNIYFIDTLVRIVNRSIDEDATVSDALKRTGKLFVPVAWASILASLTITAGFILLIVPGMIFSVWYFFPLFVLVSENVWGSSALRRSHSLVRGRFWPSAVRIGMIGLVGFALMAAAACAAIFLLTLLSVIPASLRGGLSDTALFAIGGFVFLLLSGLFSLYVTAATVRLYIILKETLPAPSVDVTVVPKAE
ncbi:MAG: hypothetical protein AAB416_00935 [Patescibacteria group bacterium]